MKNKNFTSGIHKQNKFQVENINNLCRRIAMRLLKRYRPKGLWDIETISNRKKYNRVAFSYE